MVNEGNRIYDIKVFVVPFEVNTYAFVEVVLIYIIGKPKEIFPTIVLLVESLNKSSPVVFE